MNIAELRLECLRLAGANENGKNPICQVKDAQHYLDWVMSPNVAIELQAPAPDINVDPEYNEHLESLDTPERALRLNGWEKSQWEYWVNANYPNIQICINSVGIHVGPTDRYMDFATTWDKQKSFNRWLIEDVENRWDRARCENYLKSEGWKVDEDHPFLHHFQKGAMETFWNGFQWGINTAVNKEMTKPHFWDGNGSFPEWLASEITKLQNQGGDGGEAFRKAMEAKEHRAVVDENNHKCTKMEPTPEEVLRAEGWEESIFEYFVNATHPNIQICINSAGVHIGPKEQYIEFATTWNPKKSTFPQWLASNLAALSNAKESTPEQSPLVSPEWTKMDGIWKPIMILEGNYRVIEAGGAFYPQRRGNGGWVGVEDNGTHIHTALVGAQLACERHKAKAKGSEGEQPETAAKPDQSAEIRQENAITFLKSIFPYSDQMTGEVNHDNDTVDFFWRGYKYRFDPSKDEISLVAKSGDAIDNNASILMTAIVRQAAKQ